MLGKLKTRLIEVAAANGVTLRRHRARADYAAFLDTLRPVATEHSLIRAGGDGDGGYLIPDDLEGVETCFSPGVDVVATFEQDMIDRGMRVFQADASVADTPLKHDRNHFERKFLGIETAGDTITLDDWVNGKAPAPTGDLILQMDIEGHEWLVLAQVSEETLTRFRIIVLELHHLEMAVEPLAVDVFTPVMNRLRRHFDLVHIHVNNCGGYLRGKEAEIPSVVEVTLLRKDRSSVRKPVDLLPHPLDQDNSDERPVFNVPASILRGGPH